MAINPTRVLEVKTQDSPELSFPKVEKPLYSHDFKTNQELINHFYRKTGWKNADAAYALAGKYQINIDDLTKDRKGKPQPNIALGFASPKKDIAIPLPVPNSVKPPRAETESPAPLREAQKFSKLTSVKLPERPKIDPFISSSLENGTYEYAKSMHGIPYGGGRGRLDCHTLVQRYLRETTGIETRNLDRGDKIYARHTDHVATLTLDNTNNLTVEDDAFLASIRPGDVLFIGHHYAKGEGNISAWHEGVVGPPVYRGEEIVDFRFTHADGYRDRSGKGHGKVREQSLVEYLSHRKRNAHRRNWDKYTHAFVGRPKNRLPEGVIMVQADSHKKNF